MRRRYREETKIKFWKKNWLSEQKCYARTHSHAYRVDVWQSHTHTGTEMRARTIETKRERETIEKSESWTLNAATQLSFSVRWINISWTHFVQTEHFLRSSKKKKTTTKDVFFSFAKYFSCYLLCIFGTFRLYFYFYIFILPICIQRFCALVLVFVLIHCMYSLRSTPNATIFRLRLRSFVFDSICKRLPFIFSYGVRCGMGVGTTYMCRPYVMFGSICAQTLPYTRTELDTIRQSRNAHQHHRQRQRSSTCDVHCLYDHHEQSRSVR